MILEIKNRRNGAVDSIGVTSLPKHKRKALVLEQAGQSGFVVLAWFIGDKEAELFDDFLSKIEVLYNRPEKGV